MIYSPTVELGYKSKHQYALILKYLIYRPTLNKSRPK